MLNTRAICRYKHRVTKSPCRLVADILKSKIMVTPNTALVNKTDKVKFRKVPKQNKHLKKAIKAERRGAEKEKRPILWHNDHRQNGKRAYFKLLTVRHHSALLSWPQPPSIIAEEARPPAPILELKEVHHIVGNIAPPTVNK